MKKGFQNVSKPIFFQNLFKYKIINRDKYLKHNHYLKHNFASKKVKQVEKSITGTGKINHGKINHWNWNQSKKFRNSFKT